MFIVCLSFTWFKRPCLLVFLCAMTQRRPRHSAWRSDSSPPLLSNSWKREHMLQDIWMQTWRSLPFIWTFLGSKKTVRSQKRTHFIQFFILTELNKTRHDCPQESQTSKHRIEPSFFILLKPPHQLFPIVTKGPNISAQPWPCWLEKEIVLFLHLESHYTCIKRAGSMTEGSDGWRIEIWEEQWAGRRLVRRQQTGDSRRLETESTLTDL